MPIKYAPTFRALLIEAKDQTLLFAVVVRDLAIGLAGLWRSFDTLSSVKRRVGMKIDSYKGAGKIAESSWR